MSLSLTALFINVFVVIQLTKADEFDNGHCLSSLSQKDCSQYDKFLEVDATISWCPRCRKGLDLGSSNCSESITPCSPGLQCSKTGLCVLDKSSCAYTYHLQDLQNLPECESNGKFSAKQCKGDKVHGRCFCYNENGKRIFGLDWYKNADTMTCACSRRRNQLESEGKISTLHCMRNGNYEPLQCDSGICWCAEEQTGRIVVGTRAVPENLLKFLPCYNGTEMGTKYLRQCESMFYAQNVLRKKLEIHGTLDVSIIYTQCDYDGSYGTYSIKSNMAYCTWRDGKTIGSYQVNANQVSNMNCYCARDHIYFEESSLEMALVCNGNGNYEPMQTLNGNIFCVDRDGFSVSGYFDEIVDCNKYLYYQ